MGIKSEATEAVWWHDDLDIVPCVAVEVLRRVVCVMSSSTSRFGVVALSVMRRVMGLHSLAMA